MFTYTVSEQPVIVTFSQINGCIFNMALTGWGADSSREGLEKRKKRKLFPPLIRWVYSWGRRSRGAPLSKIFHASSFICGCSSCPVSSTVTPEHSAAAKHLAPSPTVQMKNKHNLPFWVSSKWGISWQIEGWFIMQREIQKGERLKVTQGPVRKRTHSGNDKNCLVILFQHLNYTFYT